MSASDDGTPRRRARRLSGEERVLWKTVAKSVTPLRRGAPAEEEPDPPAPEPAARPDPVTAKPVAPAPPARPAAAVPQPPVLETLGRRDRKRIARGRHVIDARLDLHGRTQAEAYDALIGFIDRSRAQGARTVLIITGKGEGAAGERGVLRRQVPMWLALPGLRASVVGFETAAAAHGGEGALYVRLRRPAASEPAGHR